MSQLLDVIVAEDNIVQSAYLARLIENLGYRALTVEDGKAALDLVQDSGAQILISDYQMPYLNGVELTQAIRDLDLDHYVHVILITGMDEDEIRSNALAAGADDFLPKGHNPTALKARLRAATRLVQHSKQLAEQHRILKEANDRINDDLNAAANAQRQLLPDIHTEVLGTQIASAFVPSAVVSGDMFGCFPLTDTLIGFYAVDVSGHGIHASLLSVAIGHLITPDFFARVVLKGQEQPAPANLARDLNARFSRSENDDYFTMFCGVLNSQTGRLDFCQAAYPSPVYIGPHGNAQTVGDGGFPIGMFPDLTYENDHMTFDKGGLLVLCSDAAHEAENTQNQAFGSERLEKVIKTSHRIETDGIPEKIVEALSVWRDRIPLEDDLTVVAFRRT